VAQGRDKPDDNQFNQNCHGEDNSANAEQSCRGSEWNYEPEESGNTKQDARERHQP
jgi:hypothetical protein